MNPSDKVSPEKNENFRLCRHIRKKTQQVTIEIILSGLSGSIGEVIGDIDKHKYEK